jgi:hypothetical protein
VKFVATKECLTKKIFHPSLFYLFLDPGSGIRDLGSGIRDPGWVKIRIRDPGSGINIPDPQHWMYCTSKKACCKKLVTATKIRAYVPREKLAVKDCHNKLSLMYLVKSLLEQVRHGEVPEQAGLPTVPLRHKGQLITLLARFLPHPTLLT